jgi:hypothetical protein
MMKQATLGAGTIAIGAIAALAALILFASAAFAAGSVSVDSGEAAAGGSVTVAVNATAGSGAGIGNYTIEVSWDTTSAAVVGNPTCTSNPAGSCQVAPGGESGVVRFAGATGDPAGLTGDVEIGTLTFTVGATAGDCADLTVNVDRMDDGDGNPLGPSASGGEVCVAQPATDTPTPEPGTATATPTATATVTPGSVPSTGGNPGDSTSNMVWLLAAAGLAIVAGGAWAVARARRI